MSTLGEHLDNVSALDCGCLNCHPFNCTSTVQVFALRKVLAGLRKVLQHYLVAGEAQEAYAQFADFKGASGDGFEYDSQTYQRMPSKKWWQLYGVRWPLLQKAAMSIFSVGTSSSSAERNFSGFGHIWTARANSLAFERVEKVWRCPFFL